MAKMIKICKIICIVFTVGTFGDLILSIILNIVEPIESDKIMAYYSINSPKQYAPLFIRRLAEASFYYLFILFVEKWCVKNDIK